MFKNIIFFITLLFSFIARAESTDFYETEIKVDVTAENASIAREQALAEANRKALYTITSRISDENSIKILEELNDNQILNFIHGMSIISEKVIDSRYLADLKISINSAVLKAYLAEKNATLTIIPESHILIIPVYSESETSQPILWEEENLWYKAWSENTTENEKITIHPIEKNNDNESIIQAENALQLNSISFDSLRQLHNNADVYVAHTINHNDSLDLIVKSPLFGTVFSKTYTEVTPISFDNAIQDTKLALMQQLQQKSISQQSQENEITIIYNFNSLKEWITTKKFIDSLSNIKKMNIDAMSGRRAQLTIYYTGELEELLSNFSSQGYKLNSSKNFFVLERI